MMSFRHFSQFKNRSHLPLLFIGMQHLQAGSTGLAREFFVMAYDQCDTDPLLLQELGVLDYQLGSYVFFDFEHSAVPDECDDVAMTHQ